MQFPVKQPKTLIPLIVLCAAIGVIVFAGCSNDKSSEPGNVPSTTTGAARVVTDSDRTAAATTTTTTTTPSTTTTSPPTAPTTTAVPDVESPQGIDRSDPAEVALVTGCNYFVRKPGDRMVDVAERLGPFLTTPMYVQLGRMSSGYIDPHERISSTQLAVEDYSGANTPNTYWVWCDVAGFITKDGQEVSSIDASMSQVIVSVEQTPPSGWLVSDIRTPRRLRDIPR